MTVSTKTESATSEIAILARILSNGKGFSPGLARHLLKLEFNEDDKGRMHELAIRNQSGSLTEAEIDELQSYANAGCLLGILQSKARKSLKKLSK